MSNYKTTAIILRTYDFNDFDKIVVLYSKEHGLIRAIAKGVKRPKSALRGRLEPLMSSHLILYEGRNLDKVSQCDIVESFKHLRKDLKKITFGLYFAELAAAFAVEKDPQSESFYNFLFESLKTLESAAEDVMLEKLLVQYEHKLISFAGYAPVFDQCYNCRGRVSFENGICFSISQGMVVCSKCSARNPHLTELTPNVYHCLVGSKNNSLNSLEIDVDTVVKVHNLMYEYISKKTNFKLKTPKLIETICLS